MALWNNGHKANELNFSIYLLIFKDLWNSFGLWSISMVSLIWTSLNYIISGFHGPQTNFSKLRTLNESDGDSENELLETETDEYEGKGSLTNALCPRFSYISLIEHTMITRTICIRFELWFFRCLLTADSFANNKTGYQWNKRRMKLRLGKKLVFIRSGEI